MASSSSSAPSSPPRIASKISSLDQEESSPHRVLALYKFVDPPLPEDSLKDLQSEIESICRQHGSRGTLLLAREGINGTICYPYDHHHHHSEQGKKEKEGKEDEKNNDNDPIVEYMKSKFDNPRMRISKVDRPIFARLKIKLKSEIVTMRKDDACPTKSVGAYIKPEKWNDLLQDPDCLVIDTRNEYEIQVGTFRNAVNPHTEHFTEFPAWMEQNIVSKPGDEKSAPKKIAMFCTGGIRCEKATNACMRLVPKDVPVYHLEGGILAYLDEIKPEQSLFDGECYVFDQRIAVTYGNEPSKKFTSSCHACRHPLSSEDVQREDFVEGLSCRWCVGNLTDKQRDRFAQRQRQIELAKKKGIDHIHDPKEKMSTTMKKQRSA